MSTATPSPTLADRIAALTARAAKFEAHARQLHALARTTRSDDVLGAARNAAGLARGLREHVAGLERQAGREE